MEQRDGSITQRRKEGKLKEDGLDTHNIESVIAQIGLNSPNLTLHFAKGKEVAFEEVRSDQVTAETSDEDDKQNKVLVVEQRSSEENNWANLFANNRASANSMTTIHSSCNC